MDNKKPLPTFIEIESLIRPGGRKPRSAKVPEKRAKTVSGRKGTVVSRGSAKTK
jgi:hypothetical protein